MSLRDAIGEIETDIGDLSGRNVGLNGRDIKEPDFKKEMSNEEIEQTIVGEMQLPNGGTEQLNGGMEQSTHAVKTPNGRIEQTNAEALQQNGGTEQQTVGTTEYNSGSTKHVDEASSAKLQDLNPNQVSDYETLKFRREGKSSLLEISHPYTALRNLLGNSHFQRKSICPNLFNLLANFENAVL